MDFWAVIILILVGLFTIDWFIVYSILDNKEKTAMIVIHQIGILLVIAGIYAVITTVIGGSQAVPLIFLLPLVYFASSYLIVERALKNQRK